MLPLLAAMTAQPVNPPMFPFVIPWDDATTGTATDVSFLNAKPAGSDGPIVVRNGIFVESKTGRRVRFLATNLGARAAFPTKQDADKIAARMAKLGINLVRFHHLQNDWDTGGGTIWVESRMHREIDPAQVDKLDYFIYALKKRGIYTNMNLTTTRKYFPDMGFPESVLQIPTEFAKKIDKVDRRMIELQKDYARRLLGRVNPYTKLHYKDDPALAFVEINNENSLVGWPGEAPGAGLEAMPEPFRGEIVSGWNRWLRGRYPNRAALEASWLKGVTIDGAPITDAEASWGFENQSQGDAGLAQAEDAKPGYAKGFVLNINSNPGPDWHIQVTMGGFRLQEGATYTLRFVGKSTAENPGRIAATWTGSDWRNVGLNPTFRLSPTPQTFVYSFTARGVHPSDNRLAFAFGNARGSVQIDDLTLRPGLPDRNVGEGWEQNSVPLVSGGTRRQSLDYAEFLVDAEAAYSNEMRQFVRDSLGIKTNIIDTQISWGGLTSLRRERAMEFADNHAYWQHPQFGAGAWDPRVWIVARRAMADEMGASNGELGSLAMYRIAGKPYTISEYNHPAPNDFQAEMMPLVSSFSAAQNWDAIYTFAYDVTGTGFENKKIQNWFSVGTNPAKVAFYPASALMIRLGLIPPMDATTTVIVPAAKPWETAFTAGDAWGRVGGQKALEERMALTTGDQTGEVRAIRRPGSARPMSVRTNPNGGKLFVSASPRVIALAGFADGQTVSASGVTMAFPRFGSRFASAMLHGTKGEPLASAPRLLLTLVGRVENTGMGWNAERTSVSDQWGTAPTVAEGIPCAVTVPGNAKTRVFALDGTGKRKSAVQVRISGGRVTFQAGHSHQTLWYEVVRS